MNSFIDFFIRHQHSKVRLIVIKHPCVNFSQRLSITWKTIFWSYRRSSLIKIAKCDVTQKFLFILFCWFSLLNLHFLSAKLSSSSSSSDFSSHYLHCISSSSSSNFSSSPITSCPISPTSSHFLHGWPTSSISNIRVHLVNRAFMIDDPSRFFLFSCMSFKLHGRAGKCKSRSEANVHVPGPWTLSLSVTHCGGDSQCWGARDVDRGIGNTSHRHRKSNPHKLQTDNVPFITIQFIAKNKKLC